MASIIKNQIIKHLSKFTKNLSQDKIGLSTLKGEGSLTNLELDEEVLMEVLDLPSWIVISKAVCNRVNVKIPWTKLKTHPICIYLDEVVLEMKTCRELRTPSNSSGKSSHQTPSAPSKYGYAEKVLDGMYVHVNNISGTFLSDTFRGDIQISQLLLQSTTPDWKPANLRATRLSLQEEGDVITFKQVEWSTVRIIVDAIETKLTGTASTPIRLITNQGHVRITIKKRVSDCGLVASKLQVLLDDILLVLTDSQLKAVILHFRSLSPVIQKATAQSKARAAEKGQTSGSSKSAQDISNISGGAGRNTSEYQYLQIVKKHDVVETSYHFLTKHVDLHLCDELNRKDTESFDRRIEGGSMQVSLQGLSLDYYPYHSAGSTRTHWNFFDESFETSETWIHSILAHFKQQYSAARREIDKLQKETKTNHVPSTNQSSSTNMAADRPTTAEVANTPTRTSSSKAKSSSNKGQDSKYPSKTGPIQQQQTQTLQQRKAVKLMSHCMIIRVQGFKFSSVATAAKMQRSDSEGVNHLLMSDKKTFCLPDDVPSIHIEYTSFYFPNELDFPVPSPIMFIQCNPLVFYLDVMTILWLNQFCFNIMQTLPDLEEFSPASSDEGQDHTDIRLDALMPKIIIPSELEFIKPQQPDRPQQLQIQISRLTATNCRIGNSLNRPTLSKLLQSLNKHKITMDSSTFPGSESDVQLVPQLFWKHAFEPNFYTPKVLSAYRDETLIGNGAIPQGTNPEPTYLPKLTTYSFRTDSCDDIWGVEVDQIWAEFTEVPSTTDRPVPFVEPIPMQIWFSWPPKQPSHSMDVKTGEKTPSSNRDDLADLHALLQLSKPVHAILNHYQFLFLMRLQNSLKQLATDLEKDQILFSEKAPTLSSQVIAVECPSVSVSLLLPEQPSPESEDVLNSTVVPDEEPGVREDEEPGVREDEERGAIEDEKPGVIEDSPSKENDGLTSRGSFNSQVQDEKVSNSDFGSVESDGVTDKRLQDIDQTGSENNFLGNNSSPGVSFVAGNVSNEERTGSSDPELHRSQSEASNLASKEETRSRRATSPMLGRSTLQVQAERKLTASSAEDLPIHTSESRSSLNSSTSMQLSTLLLKSNSSASLDDLALKEDSDLLSVDSDSSDGFSFVNRRDDPRGSSLDVGSESGFGSELSQSTLPGQKDNSAQNESINNVNESSSKISTATDYSNNPFKLKNVSLVRATLHDFSAGVLLMGKDFSVKASVQNIAKSEDGNIDFDVFMGRFDSGDQKQECEVPVPDVSAGSGPVALLRFDSGPSAEKLCETAQERGYVQLKAKNINVDVLQTTISHVTGIVQDELKSPPMPLSIVIKDSHVHLIDNVPPAYPTNTEGSDPLPLRIPSLHVFRSPDGVFHLEGISSTGSSVVNQSTFEDGIELEQSNVENERIENNQLRQRVKMMEEAMEVLEHERISLMSTLEHLQEELLTSDRQKDELLYKLNELRRKVDLGK